MGKNLVLTMAIGDFHKEMAALTVPFIGDYASKIGADFDCITSQKISKSTPFWEKFAISDYLDRYDRVLFLDSDILIRKDCPNLFDFVPAQEIGMYNEGLLTTREEKEGHVWAMKNTFDAYNISFPETWDGRFFNTGVMVVPKAAKYLFTKPEKEIDTDYREQGYLNMKFLEYNVVSEIFDIGYKFNRMPYVDSKVKESRFKSYIIHYAGIRSMDILYGITQDLKTWKELLNESVCGIC